MLTIGGVFGSYLGVDMVFSRSAGGFCPEIPLADKVSYGLLNTGFCGEVFPTLLYVSSGKGKQGFTLLFGVALL